MSTNLVTTEKGFSLAPTSLAEAMKFSDIIANSDMVPKDYKGKPANVLVAVQMGAEIGLQPMQALQNIAVINGRPSVWGDAALAIVKAHPDFEWIKEELKGTGEQMVATCTLKRKNQPEQTRTFSVEDAKRAGLWGKEGPWKQYPQRMLPMRARSWTMRDVMPDALKGMRIAEEESDRQVKDMGAAEVVTGPPAYPDDAFEKNLPAWRAVITAGTKTAQEIIDMVSTKGALTDDQKAKIKGTYKEPQA